MTMILGIRLIKFWHLLSYFVPQHVLFYQAEFFVI